MKQQGTPPGERFPRWCRLIHQREFQTAFREGRRMSVPDIKIVVRKNDLGWARLGLAVSRKVGNAVVRNKMKRRLREIFRKSREQFPYPIDIVVVPYRGSEQLSYDELSTRVVGAILRGCRRIFDTLEEEQRKG